MAGHKKLWADGLVHPCTVVKKSGEVCQGQAVPESDPPRCIYHGGNIVKDNPWLVAKIRKGRWSKHLPQHLQKRYVQYLEDKEILSLREDLALLDVRLGELLSQIDTKETGQHWSSLQKITADYRKLVRKFKGLPAQELTEEFLSELFSVIDGGSSQYMIWAEIRGLVDERKKVAESERKRLIEMNQMITTEEAMVFQRAIFNIIIKNVKDPRALAQIAGEIDALGVIGDSGPPTQYVVDPDDANNDSSEDDPPLAPVNSFELTTQAQ